MIPQFWIADIVLNIGAEFIGILITIYVIDRLVKQRDERKEQEQFNVGRFEAYRLLIDSAFVWLESLFHPSILEEFQEEAHASMSREIGMLAPFPIANSEAVRLAANFYRNRFGGGWLDHIEDGRSGTVNDRVKEASHNSIRIATDAISMFGPLLWTDPKVFEYLQLVRDFDYRPTYDEEEIDGMIPITAGKVVDLLDHFASRAGQPAAIVRYGGWHSEDAEPPRRAWHRLFTRQR